MKFDIPWRYFGDGVQILGFSESKETSAAYGKGDVWALSETGRFTDVGDAVFCRHLFFLFVLPFLSLCFWRSKNKNMYVAAQVLPVVALLFFRDAYAIALKNAVFVVVVVAVVVEPSRRCSEVNL